MIRPSNVLREMGERTAGPEGMMYLDRAISAHRAALEVQTRLAGPAD